MTVALAPTLEETEVSRGWLLYKIRRGELLLLLDPDCEHALDDALLAGHFEGGLSEWFGRLVDVTPTGWEIMVFEREYVAAIHSLQVTSR